MPKSKKPAPEPGSEPDIPADGKWSVKQLLGLASEESSWIIGDILRKGSQVVLAAAPKCGKSRIASQLALTLSVPFTKGEKRRLFNALPTDDPKSSGFEVTRPEAGAYRVLFFSLEMGQAEVTRRLRLQLEFFGIKAPKPENKEAIHELPNIQLTHVFGLEVESEDGSERTMISDLKIIEVENQTFNKAPEIKLSCHGRSLEEIIAQTDPDVVIYDTLIQLHDVNENDNMLMKAVLRMLRRITVKRGPEGNGRAIPIAHIVVHHTRKEGGARYGRSLSAEMVRGAGSVHGVADLVMTAQSVDASGRVEMNISSRSSSVPNFELRSNADSLCFEWIDPDEIDSEPKLSKTELREQLLNELLVESVRKSGERGFKVQAEFGRLLFLKEKSANLGRKKPLSFDSIKKKVGKAAKLLGFELEQIGTGDAMEYTLRAAAKK